MDVRGLAVALISVLFLALALGTTTGLFSLSLLSGTRTGTTVVMALLGAFGLLYLWWRRR